MPFTNKNHLHPYSQLKTKIQQSLTNIKHPCAAIFKTPNSSLSAGGRRCFLSDVTLEKSWKFLTFCSVHRIWGRVTDRLIKPRSPQKAPASATAYIQPKTPGYQAPVRPQPEPRRRKFRTSCFLEAEHQKGNISSLRRAENSPPSCL